jgi:hypothetical protein
VSCSMPRFCLDGNSCGGDIVVRGVYRYHHDVRLCHILLYDNKVTVADIGLARVAEEKDID